MDTDALHQLVEAQLQQHAIPGVALACVDETGIRSHVTFGVHADSHQPITATSRFQAASLSKPLVAYDA